MNSKSKIWQIVLLVLLVLAIAAILLFNNKLNASKQTLSDTVAQLTEEKENSATLQANLDVAGALPNVTGSARIRDALKETAQKVGGGMDPAAQLKELVDTCNKALQGN